MCDRSVMFETENLSPGEEWLLLVTTLCRLRDTFSQLFSKVFLDTCNPQDVLDAVD